MYEYQLGNLHIK